MQISDLVKPESIPTLGVISCPSSPLIFLMLNKLRIVTIASHKLTSARCLPGHILVRYHHHCNLSGLMDNKDAFLTFVQSQNVPKARAPLDLLSILRDNGMD